MGLRMMEAMKAWSMNFSALMMDGFAEPDHEHGGKGDEEDEVPGQVRLQVLPAVPVLHDSPPEEPEEREGCKGDGQPEEAQVPGEGHECEDPTREGDGIGELSE